MHEHVVLCTAKLDGLGNFWVHVLDVGVEISIAFMHIVLTLMED